MFAPKVGDVVVFSGINVFDRRTVGLGPADKQGTAFPPLPARDGAGLPA